MSIVEYEKDGKTYFQAYVCVRSKINSRIKVQIRSKKDCSLQTYKQAQKEEKRLLIEATKRVSRRESSGATWGEIIERWASHHKKYPTRRFNIDTLNDHVARMKNWTPFWINRIASEITIGDARDVLRDAFEKGASYNLRRSIKGTINILFKWGIEENLIPNCNKSPAKDLEIEGRASEKMPEILNMQEISQLLIQAKKDDHPWYPVWKVGFLSGMRSSELEALRKEDIELPSPEDLKKIECTQNYGIIRVRRSWKIKQRTYGSTKGRYWRNVPINKELYNFLIDYLKNDFGIDEHGKRVFPILPNWRRSEQAKVLRCFCEAYGFKSIKFHTIRACFATQLISSGIPATTVMKIGGWKDYKTMMIYVRLAGVDEAGATAGLNFEPEKVNQNEPTPPPPETKSTVEPENVVSFNEFRNKRAL